MCPTKRQCEHCLEPADSLIDGACEACHQEAKAHEDDACDMCPDFD